MNQYPGLIKKAPPLIRNNKKIIKYVISKNAELFQYASTKIKKDKKFILNLVKEEASYGIREIYKFCDESLKKDY